FDLVALLVGFARPGAIALYIHVQMHLDNLVRSQETIADALLERIGIHWRAKVVDVGNVGSFSGCGGQADRRCRSKIVKNFPPGGILSGAVAVTLVDHDQIEKAGGEVAKELLPLFWSRNGLIEPEVDFVGGIDAALPIDSCGECGRAAVVT